MLIFRHKLTRAEPLRRSEPRLLSGRSATGFRLLSEDLPRRFRIRKLPELEHHHPIGYFIGDRVVDFNSLNEEQIPAEVQRNRQNAHIKRYLRSRDRRQLADLVITQAKRPSVLLDEAVKLSGGRPDAPNYYFAKGWLDAWAPSTAYLGGIKPVIAADIGKAEFLNSLERVAGMDT